MDDLKLLIDLHKGTDRQGPGDIAETVKAIQLAKLDTSKPLKIADIGCGTGASTIQLAKHLNAQVTAVDFLQEFTDILKEDACTEGLDNIHPLVCSMDDLPFSDDEYDVIWSEGAIYNMGFESGIKAWRRFLKPGGKLVVSELTWSTGKRPSELQKYWENEYPEIDTASANIKILEDNGYSLIGYFLLPERCWLDNYYRPLQRSYRDFLKRNNHSREAQDLISVEEQEIAIYEKYKEFYSYGMYIATKR